MHTRIRRASAGGAGGGSAAASGAPPRLPSPAPVAGAWGGAGESEQGAAGVTALSAVRGALARAGVDTNTPGLRAAARQRELVRRLVAAVGEEAAGRAIGVASVRAALEAAEAPAAAVPAGAAGGGSSGTITPRPTSAHPTSARPTSARARASEPLAPVASLSSSAAGAEALPAMLAAESYLAARAPRMKRSNTGLPPSAPVVGSGARPDVAAAPVGAPLARSRSTGATGDWGAGITDAMGAVGAGMDVRRSPISGVRPAPASIGAAPDPPPRRRAAALSPPSQRSSQRGASPGAVGGRDGDPGTDRTARVAGGGGGGGGGGDGSMTHRRALFTTTVRNVLSTVAAPIAGAARPPAPSSPPLEPPLPPYTDAEAAVDVDKLLANAVFCFEVLVDVASAERKCVRARAGGALCPTRAVACRARAVSGVRSCGTRSTCRRSYPTPRCSGSASATTPRRRGHWTARWRLSRTMWLRLYFTLVRALAAPAAAPAVARAAFHTIPRARTYSNIHVRARARARAGRSEVFTRRAGRGCALARPLLLRACAHSLLICAGRSGVAVQPRAGG